MVFVGCALPSCPKSSNLVVPPYCSLNMLEGDIGYALYFMPFLDFFLSLKNIVIIDVYLKSSIFLCLWRAILMCDSIGALSLFLLLASDQRTWPPQNNYCCKNIYPSIVINFLAPTDNT